MVDDSTGGLVDDTGCAEGRWSVGRGQRQYSETRMQRTWEAWYGILATVGEAKTTGGLGAGKEEAEAVQQEAQVGRDQVDRHGAPEIGVSVAHPGQVVLECQHVPLLKVSEPYVGPRR